MTLRKAIPSGLLNKQTYFSIFIIIACLVLTLASIYSPDIQAESADPIQQTQEVLTRPEAREQALEQDPKARQVDQSIQQLTGPSGTHEDVYQAASKIFTRLAQESQGDEQKLKELVEKAQKNPEAFGKQLTPEELQMIRQIASQIESSKPKAP